MVRGLRRSKRDRGAAAAEFAVVLPVLLLLVFGIIDFARMASDRIALTAAAHAAAQALATPTGNPGIAATAALSGASVTASHRCGTTPTTNEMATATVSFNFTFATPIAALANLRGTPMQATGAVPCRG